MNPLKTGVGPLYVIEVRFSAAGESERSVWLCRGKKAPERTEVVWPRLPEGVWVLTVQGQGVVSKPSSSGTAARVISDPETFVWSETDGMLSFVRRERLLPLLDELSERRIYVQCTAVNLAPEEAARSFYDGLSWRNLLGLNDRASALSQAAARRLLPAVAGLLLLLLGANATVSGSLQAERQRLAAVAEQRLRSGRAEAEGAAERERILADFSQKPALAYSLLCDRIGECVPDAVRLTSLDVEPLKRRFEADRPVQRLRGHVAIEGACTRSSPIGDFVERLSGSRVARSVRLTSVESRREGGLAFRIDLEL